MGQGLRTLMSKSLLARANIVAIALAITVLLVWSAPLAATSEPSRPEIDARVDAILASMTLQDKIDLIGGVDGFFVRALPNSNWPRLKMADGPMGVRNFGPATAMPGGINLAATWDPALAQSVGEQIGRDARAKGVNFVLGPGVNIYRAPMNGRNFEYFGEDPYLASRMAVGYIEGMQSEGVSATIKHFMGNNSEYARHQVDDVIDERTMREIYLPVFEAAVKEAHVGAVMDSYNLVNGQHMTQNAMLNTDILKKDWGFSGVLMSDWFATYDGVAAAKSGLDLEMPSGMFMNFDTLGPAVQSGQLSLANIDDKVRRILRLAVESHWLDRIQADLAIPRFNLSGDAVALRASIEGMVLLKNEDAVLPLDKGKIKSLAVIGPDAYPAVPVGGGSAGVHPFVACSFLEGISRAVGSAVPIHYDRGVPDLSDLAQRTTLATVESGGNFGVQADYFSNETLSGTPFEHRVETHINFGADPNADLGYSPPVYPANAGSARWAGFYKAPNVGAYDFFVQSAGEGSGYYRVFVDDKLILDNWTEARALVGLDTLDLSAGVHKVVVEHHSGGSVDMRDWIDRVPALLEAWYPGQEGGAALAQIVLGEADPSGRLPVSFERRWEDNPVHDSYYPEPGTEQVVYKEGVFVGYRGYEHTGVKPLFSFGYGLSYTTFRYRDLSVRAISSSIDRSSDADGPPEYEVSFDVTNTGRRDGADVAEVYVGEVNPKVPGPARELKGFARIALRPGETRRAKVLLNDRAFAYYDVSDHKWRIDPGEFTIFVGSSVDQIQLQNTISLNGH